MLKISQVILVLISLIIFTTLSGLFAAKWGQEIEKRYEIRKPSVTINTNKTIYNREETIYYIVKNNKETSIWFESDSPNTAIIDIENKIGVWMKLGNSLPCLRPGIVREPPDFIEIKPNEERRLSWNQTFCSFPHLIDKKASEGIYRIKFRYYSDRFKDERSEVYSNEFTIK